MQALTKQAERLALLGSVVGIPVAVFLDQLLIAAAPLTVALSLNTVNRYRLEQQLRTAIQTQGQVGSLEQPQTLQLKAQLERLQTQIVAVKSLNLDAVIAKLHQFDLDGLMAQQTAAQTVQTELGQLKTLVSEVQAYGSGIAKQVRATLDPQIEVIQTALGTVQSCLVFDRTQSRQVLIEALTIAEERLILVCPWLSKYSVDDQLKPLIRERLDDGIAIQIGYGYRKDIKQQTLGQNYLYNALGWLEHLREQYPNHLQLKVLGTHEKYLVCDRTFAMLGSHNFLCSGDRARTQDLEVGLQTTDQNIINRLICRFEESREVVPRQKPQAA